MKISDLNLSALDLHMLELYTEGNLINAEFIFTRKREHDKMMRIALERVNTLGKPLENNDETT